MAKKPNIYKQVEELEKQMQKLDERFDMLSKFRGVYLTEKYVGLKQDVENTVTRAIEYGEWIPQKVSGLTRKLKNINDDSLKRLFDYVKIYSPELDRSFTLETLQKHVAEPLVRGAGNVRNQEEAIYFAKREAFYNRQPLLIESQVNEVYFSDAVLEKVWNECNKHGTTALNNSPWEEIIKKIQEKIDETSYEAVAKTFEQNVNDTTVSGDLGYDDAVKLVDAMEEWDWLELDLETNKELTNGMELEYGFTEV